MLNFEPLPERAPLPCALIPCSVHVHLYRFKLPHGTFRLYLYVYLIVLRFVIIVYQSVLHVYSS